MTLIKLADEAYPIVKNSKLKPAEKMAKLSGLVQEGQGLGETWAKMLTVCIDLAYPKERLLESQCDVGTGAVAPMRCLLRRVDQRIAGPRYRTSCASRTAPR